ncbi:MAG: uracil-DNA glycosylase [Marinilabiliales bacterium]|nr:MAG: uracil-DNA glycosylase [Marinilabiliales bacterium]
MNPEIENSWKEILNEEFNKPYFHELKAFLVEEKQKHRIFPPGQEIFNAFNSASFHDIKVVILGQDPYHGPGQAHGLCFSVADDVPHPPSLKNIFKELQTDIPGFTTPKSGNLQKWANQGVLLLNAVLTVRAHQAESHRKKGWETFTDKVIETVANERDGLVFMLWGNYARAKSKIIDHKKHLVLESAHPSPLSASRGFFGCRHFSKANEYLNSKNKTPINWHL